VLDDARPSEVVSTIRAVADCEYLIDDAVAVRRLQVAARVSPA
jgi:hypothetical protein